MPQRSINESSAVRSKTSSEETANQVRRLLKDGGFAEHASGVQWFFKDAIKSHGWYTADLRRAAIRFRRDVKTEPGLDFLVKVADRLFFGSRSAGKDSCV